MLVGITGTICAGKHTTAEFLIQHHGFLRLHLPRKPHTYPPHQQPTTAPETKSDPASDYSKHFLPSVTDQRGTRGLTFPDVDSLLDFVTKRWQEHWVLTDIDDEATLSSLLRRPFFLLLAVDAPITTRYARFTARCHARSLPPLPLEHFLAANDHTLYAHCPGTARLAARAHVQLLNAYTETNAYFAFLATVDLPSESRLRPPWDAYFMHLAHLASLRSNCMKRRVGCVLTLNSRILSTGYNGTPRGLTNCNMGGCPRCNSGTSSSLSTCLCLHAEENALLEAGRERIRDGAVLYCDTCPCLTCSVKIAQVGVREVVYSQGYNMDEASRRVLAEAGVKLRQYSPPEAGLLGGDMYSTDNQGMDLVVRNGG